MDFQRLCASRVSARSDEPLPDGKVQAPRPATVPGHLPVPQPRPAESPLDAAPETPVRRRACEVVLGQVPIGHMRRVQDPWRHFDRTVYVTGGTVLALLMGVGFAQMSGSESKRFAQFAATYALAWLSAVTLVSLARLIHTAAIDARAECRERHHVESKGLTAWGQAQRVLALAQRQPLNALGLRQCIDRLRQLQRLSPGTISGQQVGGAIVSLAASPALDILGDGTRMRPQDGDRIIRDLAVLARGLLALEADKLVPPQSSGQLLLELGRVVQGRGGEGSGSILVATALADAAGLPERSVPYATTDAQRHRALAPRLFEPGTTPAQKIEGILAAVRQAPSKPAWLADVAIEQVVLALEGMASLPHMEALGIHLVDLARAHGQLNARQLASMLKTLAQAGSRIGGDQAAAANALLRGRAADLAHSQGPRLTAPRMLGLVQVLEHERFFVANPDDEEAIAQVLASLASASTPFTARAMLRKLACAIVGPELARQALRPIFEPEALLEALRTIPVNELSVELSETRLELLDGVRDPLAQARVHLRIMDVVSQRSATPHEIFTQGLLSCRQVRDLVEGIAAQAPVDGNRDRAEVIARLMQAPQEHTSEALLRHAVATIIALPEFQPTGLDPAIDQQRRKLALDRVLQACTITSIFISATDQRAAARLDAEEADPPGDPATATSAALEHAWLTPALIDELVAPVMGLRESKHG